MIYILCLWRTEIFYHYWTKDTGRKCNHFIWDFPTGIMCMMMWCWLFFEDVEGFPGPSTWMNQPISILSPLQLRFPNWHNVHDDVVVLVILSSPFQLGLPNLYSVQWYGWWWWWGWWGWWWWWGWTSQQLRHPNWHNVRDVCTTWWMMMMVRMNITTVETSQLAQCAWCVVYYMRWWWWNITTVEISQLAQCAWWCVMEE